MKKLLIASTALTALAGASFADVSVGGDGRMGIVNDGTDTTLSSRVRVSFSASGETDTGLSFGGSIRADNAGVTGVSDGSATKGGVSGLAGSVNIAGDNWKLSMGDVGSGAKSAVGHLSGVGFAGLGSKNSFQYLSAADPSVQAEFSASGATMYVSAGKALSGGSNEYGVGLKYSMDAFTVAAGYEKAGSASNTAVSASANLQGIDVKAGYVTKGSNSHAQQGASVSYSMDAMTATAFYRKDKDGKNNTGVGIAYDLGGGAAVKGGFVDQSGSNQFDLGLTFSF